MTRKSHWASVAKTAPDAPLNPPTIRISDTMNEKERDIAKKNRLIVAQMRNFTAEDLNLGSVKCYLPKLDKISQMREELVESIEEMLLDDSSEMDSLKAEQLRTKINNIEHDVRLYMRRMHTKAAEVNGGEGSFSIDNSSQEKVAVALENANDRFTLKRKVDDNINSTGAGPQVQPEVTDAISAQQKMVEELSKITITCVMPLCEAEVSLRNMTAHFQEHISNQELREVNVHDEPEHNELKQEPFDSDYNVCKRQRIYMTNPPFNFAFNDIETTTK